MDPDMEHHYKELLRQWKNDEDNIKDELKEISTDVKEIGTDVKEIGTDVKGISTDVKEIKELTKKLDNWVASTLTPEVQSSNEGGYYVGTTYKQGRHKHKHQHQKRDTRYRTPFF